LAERKDQKFGESHLSIFSQSVTKSSYHLLMYLHLLDSPSTSITTKYRTVSMPGHYALVHCVADSVFQDVTKTSLYTAKYKAFRFIKYVRLSHGWGKETDLNHMSIDQFERKRIQDHFYL